MFPTILFRKAGFEEEYNIAKKYFYVVEYRHEILFDSLVIPRYSALPYYKELEADVEWEGDSKLINSYKQHLYVADLKNWYEDLKEFTPKTWFQLHEVPWEQGPMVLKGETNSKKFQWNETMFADNARKGAEIYCDLATDGLIGQQSIYIRKYIPLKKLDEAPCGLPISEEYRFFILDGEVLTGAFYWSNYVEDIDPKLINVNKVPKDFLNKIIELVGDKIRFWVLDVAHTQDDNWIVIELNDGSMSGLSENDPHILYSKLKERLT